jgi:hypothetical protein
MSKRLYYVGIRWKESPANWEIVDRAMSPLGDWIRLNGLTWLLASDLSSKDIYQRLLHTTNLTDQILVIALDPAERYGWAPAWIWSWLDSQRLERPPTLAEILERAIPSQRTAT